MHNVRDNIVIKSLEVGATIKKEHLYHSTSGEWLPVQEACIGHKVLDNGVEWGYILPKQTEYDVWDVVWPYDDCTVFARGVMVLYTKVDKMLFFYHPKKDVWMKSNRPNIMEDSCSTFLSSKKVTRSELPTEDSKTE